MMPPLTSDKDRPTLEEIEILVFMAAGGRFGADARQVFRVIRPAKTTNKRGGFQKITPQPDGYLFNQEGVVVVDLAAPEWDWSAGEPPEAHPAYYDRTCKTFSRMGGSLHALTMDNRDFLLALCHALG